MKKLKRTYHREMMLSTRGRTLDELYSQVEMLQHLLEEQRKRERQDWLDGRNHLLTTTVTNDVIGGSSLPCVVGIDPSSSGSWAPIYVRSATSANSNSNSFALVTSV